MILGTQLYPFQQACEASGKQLSESLDEVLAGIAEAGFEAVEAIDWRPERAKPFSELLARHKLRLASFYTGGALHVPDWRASVRDIVSRARAAVPLGARIITCNPDPLLSEPGRDKSDDELTRQAEALQTLGEQLGREGLRLAYHAHDPEMRSAAREYHHMLLGTSPEAVGLCLDTHWVYRGAGNSELALYDIAGLYAGRIACLHLRQSRAGVWSEVFGDGDIDHRPLLHRLRQSGFAGPVYLEQAREAGTPATMDVFKAHRQGLQELRLMLRM